MTAHPPVVAEQWRPISGFENFYEVSDLGRVRSLDRIVIDSNGVRRRYRGRQLSLIWTHLRRDGVSRYAVTLNKNGHARFINVADLVLLTFVGPRPPDHEARHRNRNPSINHLDNLTWGPP
jgi:hypothetical protein